MIHAPAQRGDGRSGPGVSLGGMSPTGHRAPDEAVGRELRRAGDAVRPRMRALVDRLQPDVRRVVAYHLGFQDELGRPGHADGGKSVRAALALLSAEAAGAPFEAGLPGAVAVELVHNFSLIHDDVMDEDELRRHRATAWTVFGVGQAIVAGDALQALAMQELVSAPVEPRLALRAATELSAATSEMIAGQSMDLAAPARDDLTLDDAVRLASAKTGALFGFASSIGAVLAGAAGELTDALRSFGRDVGIAFQAVDDLLGIWGRSEVTGKPAASDIRERKRSLPVVAALVSGTDAGRCLAEVQSEPGFEHREDLVERAAGLVEEAGGRAWAAAEADRRVASAREALRSAPVAEEHRDRLLAIAAFIAGREA